MHKRGEGKRRIDSGGDAWPDVFVWKAVEHPHFSQDAVIVGVRVDHAEVFGCMGKLGENVVEKILGFYLLGG